MSFLIVFIQIFINILSFAIILRVLLSWITPFSSRAHSFSQVIHDITEPFLRLIRKIPHKVGMIDLSPIIVLFLLDFVGNLIITLLTRL